MSDPRDGEVVCPSCKAQLNRTDKNCWKCGSAELQSTARLGLGTKIAITDRKAFDESLAAAFRPDKILKDCELSITKGALHEANGPELSESLFEAFFREATRNGAVPLRDLIRKAEEDKKQRQMIADIDAVLAKIRSALIAAKVVPAAPTNLRIVREELNANGHFVMEFVGDPVWAQPWAQKGPKS